MTADPRNQPDKRRIYDPQAIDWDEIEEWRRIPGSEKVLMGLRLQEMARRVTLAGIRHQHPDADEEEVQRIFAERMAVNNERA
jgi:hypothetical protein